MNNLAISNFNEWIEDNPLFTIQDLIYKWRYKQCGMSGFSLYIEVEGIDDAYLKLSKKKLTFYRMQSVISLGILNKIRTWFEDDVQMNSKLMKSSFSVYSRSANKLPVFIALLMGNKKYSIQSIDTDWVKYFHVIIKEESGH